MVIAYQQVFDLPYTIVRPSALYGPRCVSRRVGQIFIENALRGQPLRDRRRRRGAARLHLHRRSGRTASAWPSSNPAARNEIFNLTYGSARSIAELVEVLQKQFPDVEVEHVERDRLMPFRGTLSVDKARQLLGYAPAFPIDRGLREVHRVVPTAVASSRRVVASPTSLAVRSSSAARHSRSGPASASIAVETARAAIAASMPAHARLPSTTPSWTIRRPGDGRSARPPRGSRVVGRQLTFGAADRAPTRLNLRRRRSRSAGPSGATPCSTSPSTRFRYYALPSRPGIDREAAPIASSANGSEATSTAGAATRLLVAHDRRRRARVPRDADRRSAGRPRRGHRSDRRRPDASAPRRRPRCWSKAPCITTSDACAIARSRHAGANVPSRPALRAAGLPARAQSATSCTGTRGGSADANRHPRHRDARDRRRRDRQQPRRRLRRRRAARRSRRRVRRRRGEVPDLRRGSLHQPRRMPTRSAALPLRSSSRPTQLAAAVDAARAPRAAVHLDAARPRERSTC